MTILALLQKSGKTLPDRRIELYDMVTRTLLANRNYETGRRYFSDSDLPLVDQVLSELAFQLHKSDFFLTKHEVNTIACQVMTEETKEAPDQTTVEHFTNTIRDSSGLFVEIGQGLFSFMHRTFQEYYVARYLLRQTPQYRKGFVRTHFTSAIWREPLLLAIASRSTENKAEAKAETKELIELIDQTSAPCDAFLQRGPLFAASSVVDCTTWSIERSVQRRIANELFDIYGDPYGKGRYTTLQQEIEKVALLWLRGQEESSQQHIWPPLLEAWRTALGDATNACRQEGAIHLLASLAPDLPTCPKLVLHALIPPLLQLANVLDISSPPPDIQRNLRQPPARPSSLRVEEYALVALRLLDAAGTAGWLHQQWLKWSNENSTFLERLTQHSLELGYLLTPAAFPAKPADQRDIVNRWKKMGQSNPRGLQMQLLQASSAA